MAGRFIMGALYIVFGLVLAGVVVLFVIYYSRTMKMTSYTSCEVVRAEDRVVRDERERREETLIVCKYSVRGKDYQIEHVIRGRNARAYPAGKELTVWYNPNVPEMARIKS
jgi:hypothetical protein